MCRPRTQFPSRKPSSERPRKASSCVRGTAGGEPPWDSLPPEDSLEVEELIEDLRDELLDTSRAMLVTIWNRMAQMEHRLLQAISRGSSGAETPAGDGGNK